MSAGSITTDGSQSSSHQFEYSLSCTSATFFNWRQGDAISTVSLVHFLKYRSCLTRSGKFSLTNVIKHFLGVQVFYDSVSRFHPDENTFDTRIEYRIVKNLNLTAGSNLATRIFNSYSDVSGQGGSSEKILTGAFLTPLVWTFSVGFGLVWPALGTLNLGLSAARLTWIRDKAVFNRSDITAFYGVPAGRTHQLEYGVSLHLQIDRDFLNRLYWNCDLLIFKDNGEPVDLVLRNLVSLKINRFLKATVQTRLFFEPVVSDQLQVENLVTLGFYVGF